ncbi:hypothetical protein IQ260_20030 [Leptolyngbya cf. ectocarpi LEGE 11479]|uniref:Uncharacterized protein n=1 Tax=Leptolyngbya cf. ectocarpi LEGE 11479 TaxID=1828722 RepID=A0A928ZWU5_LEPEC|nr:hypothetical protein [Leptolyngbya ectocarpi]MBE9068936.1 hypothetical protein [Leptolyngbya cf. ectocarpi LEGE 11479]
MSPNIPVAAPDEDDFVPLDRIGLELPPTGGSLERRCRRGRPDRRDLE